MKKKQLATYLIYSFSCTGNMSNNMQTKQQAQSDGRKSTLSFSLGARKNVEVGDRLRGRGRLLLEFFVDVNNILH